ncbi:MAG: hypothetical protein ACTSYY_04125, partial [Promethearchaeota archaeon]
MKKHKKQKISLLILSFFLIQAINFQFLPLLTSYNAEDSLTDGTNKNLLSENIEDEQTIDLPSIAGASSWWNENFDSRIEIDITEPNIKDRASEPIDVYFTFSDGKCYINSTRIVFFDGDLQSEVPSQIWNITDWGNDYIKSCSITFLVTILQNTVKKYYLYYSSFVMDNNSANYYTQTQMNTTLSLGRAQIDTNALYYEFAESTGYDVLKFSSEIETGTNFHTKYSMSPLSVFSSGGSSQTYYPDANGFICDWLLVGGFDTGGWGNTPATDVLDMTKYYVEGDTIGSKSWFVRNDDYDIDLNTLLTPNDYAWGFAMAYVYLPVDISDFYLLLGSDDGIVVYFDRVEVWNYHVARGRNTDQDLVSLGLVSSGWHSILIGVEERTGGWGFRCRFSNGSTYTPITNQKISLTPKGEIDSIILEEEGPIFSQFRIIWEDSGTMKTWDTVTFYAENYLYKTERTFWFKDDIDSINGNNWTITNTIYPDTTTTGLDVFVEDGTSITRPLTSDGFNAEKYVFIYDDDNSKRSIAQGIFITDFYLGNDYMTISSINTTAIYSNNQPKIIPGYQTDYDNAGPRSGNWPTDSDYNLTVEYWEMAKENMGRGSDTINQELTKFYNSIKNPLQWSNSSSESLFFNFDVQLYDTDGNGAPGVNVTLYNTTANWSGVHYGTNAINSFEPLSLKSDDSGHISFTNLKENNLTCVVSYQAYNKPAYNLTSFNITMNTTQSHTVYNLNLTQINLKLQSLANPNDVIIGANVSLYWNNSDSAMDDYGGYIGYESSDGNGEVHFYYLNSSEAQGNYSIKVYSFGEYRNINYTYVQGSDLKETINFTAASYTSKNISVQMAAYSSNLNRTVNNLVDIYGNLVDTHSWGENLTIIANYTFGVLSGTFTAIEDASLTYSILDNELHQIVKSGVLTENATKGGYYYLTFNSSDLDTNRLYILDIFAEKGGFQPGLSSVLIQLKDISTGLNINIDETEPNWRDEFSIQVYYNDTLNNRPIENAMVSVSSGVLYEIMDEDGDGYYSITLNTTQFSHSGSFTLSIQAELENFSISLEVRDITIKSVSTSLTPEETSIEVYWNDNFTLNMQYYDLVKDFGIDSAVLSWFVVGIPSVSGLFNYDEVKGDGWYTTDINSSVFTYAGIYNIEVHANNENYDNKSVIVNIYIMEIYTLLNNSIMPIYNAETYFGESDIFYFDYSARIGGSSSNQFISLENVTYAYYEWEMVNNSEIKGSGYLEYSSSLKLYSLDFNTEIRDIGEYVITIRLQEPNYVARISAFTLDIIKRPFKIEWNNELSEDNPALEVIKGNNIELTFILKDYITGDSLSGATVSLFLIDLGSEIQFTEANGTYTLVFTTDEYDAFVQDNIIRAQIIISKANYSTTIKDIQITVKMDEIFEGVPFFYFILAVGALTILIGSLIGYKLVQNARIPAFVKVINKVISDISGKKTISDENISVSAKAEIVEKFDEYWKLIDLDLNEILGLNKGAIPSDELSSSGEEAT